MLSRVALLLERSCRAKLRALAPFGVVSSIFFTTAEFYLLYMITSSSPDHRLLLYTTTIDSSARRPPTSSHDRRPELCSGQGEQPTFLAPQAPSLGDED